MLSTQLIVFIALCARYLSILVPLYLFGRDSQVCSKTYTKEHRSRERRALSKLLTWGGLKGGISIALALGTVKIFTPSTYNYVVICTYAVVVFSTLAQGLTISKVYTKIKKNLYF